MGYQDYARSLSKDTKDAWNCVIQAIVSDSSLSHWNSRYIFYTQTIFCTIGMGYVGMHTACDSISMTATMNETKGGPCGLVIEGPTCWYLISRHVQSDAGLLW